jgi:hypothetical protein
MMADHQGNIHAFNDQQVGDSADSVIFHRIWNQRQGWSAPVDILYRGKGINVVVLDAMLDENQDLHLLFFEGDPRSAFLYHTSTPVSEADTGSAWSNPQLIAENVGPLAYDSIVSLRPENLTIVYVGQEEGNGIYEIHSDDGGLTWSDLEVVFLTGDVEIYPASIRTHFDGSKYFHVIWGNMNDRGIGEAVYYTRLDKDTGQWKKPFSLAKREGTDYSTTWSAIITDKNGNLIAIYQDSFPAARFMRLSTDQGETWELPVRPFPHIGEYENAVLLKDSNDIVHMILGNRLVGEPDIHGMWHSVWENNDWSDLVPVVSGPRRNTFDPSAPQAEISQGNVILAAWRNDVNREYQSGPWYSSKTLDAPAMPTVPPPTEEVLPTPTEQLVLETTEPQSTTVPTPEIEHQVTPSISSVISSNPMMTILVSLVPAAIILLGIFLFKLISGRKS